MKPPSLTHSSLAEVAVGRPKLMTRHFPNAATLNLTDTHTPGSGLSIQESLLFRFNFFLKCNGFLQRYCLLVGCAGCPVVNMERILKIEKLKDKQRKGKLPAPIGCARLPVDASGAAASDCRHQAKERRRSERARSFRRLGNAD